MWVTPHRNFCVWGIAFALSPEKQAQQVYPHTAYSDTTLQCWIDWATVGHNDSLGVAMTSLTCNQYGVFVFLRTRT
jgi:hypothetical protein